MELARNLIDVINFCYLCFVQGYYLDFYLCIYLFSIYLYIFKVSGWA